MPRHICHERICHDAFAITYLPRRICHDAFVTTHLPRTHLPRRICHERICHEFARPITTLERMLSWQMRSCQMRRDKCVRGKCVVTKRSCRGKASYATFCYHPYSEITSMQVDEISVPIYAWGSVKVTYYGLATLAHVHLRIYICACTFARTTFAHSLLCRCFCACSICAAYLRMHF